MTAELAPHATPGGRAAHGRAAREACPRRSHAGFEPTGRDPIAFRRRLSRPDERDYEAFRQAPADGRIAGSRGY
jgi:hypothetical protein